MGSPSARKASDVAARWWRQPPDAAPELGRYAPWFSAPVGNQTDFRIDSVGGRFVLLAFFGSSSAPAGRRHLDQLLALERHYDDGRLCFFGVSCDPRDAAILTPRLPGIRYVRDADRAVSALYGAWIGESYRRLTVLIDPSMRIVAVVPFDHDPAAHGETVAQVVASLPHPAQHAGTPLHAPVLIAPRVFDRELCDRLVALHRRHGGEESGFMREVGELTVAAADLDFKRRRDCPVGDGSLRAACRKAIRERLLPQIEQAFTVRLTRIERYIVARYAADTGGFFRPHRDNTTRGTAHRRFAVTINLNPGPWEGGDLRFPEYGPRTYRAPMGGAVVFSCSLLHECTPMVRGERYCFLPFLYDEEGSRLREANLKYVGASVACPR